MLIKELREAIKELPDDADIIMVKRLHGKETIFASVLTYRITQRKDKMRLVLENNLPVEKR